MSKKIIVSFGAKWNMLRVAVNPKDLARTLDFIEGLDFVDTNYADGEVNFHQVAPRKVEIEMADKILPPKADE